MGIVNQGWLKGKNRGKSNISWENLWFPLKIFPLVNPLRLKLLKDGRYDLVGGDFLEHDWMILSIGNGKIIPADELESFSDG